MYRWGYPGQGVRTKKKVKSKPVDWDQRRSEKSARRKERRKDIKERKKAGWTRTKVEKK